MMTTLPAPHYTPGADLIMGEWQYAQAMKAKRLAQRKAAKLLKKVMNWPKEFRPKELQ